MHELIQFQVSPGSCEDKAPYCATMDRADCYYDSYRLETCCKRCRDELSGITGQYRQRNFKALQAIYSPNIFADCAFGDKVSWCEKYIDGRDCFTLDRAEHYLDKCCETCNRTSNLTGETHSCRDRAKFCGDLFPGYCYYASDRATCCKRCQEVRNETPGEM